MPVSLAQTIELFTHVLSGIIITITLDKEQKYRTVRLNTGHLATLATQQVEDWLLDLGSPNKQENFQADGEFNYKAWR